jgi:hypothetical protein
MTYLRFSALVGVALVGGCGLISSDVTNLDLTIKPKMFSVDTASWNVNPTAANTYLSYNCATTPSYCSTAVSNACAMGCSGSCDTAKHTCDLGLDVSIYQMVDLLTEQPELKTINQQPVIHVTIDSVSYTVMTNSLNVPTPPLTIYVAPASVMDAKDPSAKAIGTIAAVPAMTTQASMEMEYTADGKQTLVDTMGNYMTPFNVLVGGTLEVTSGQPLPSGKLDAAVQIKAHAGV